MRSDQPHAKVSRCAPLPSPDQDHQDVQEVAFEEDMTFDRPRHVMDLKIEMKKGRAPWHFLGINQATLVL